MSFSEWVILRTVDKHGINIYITYISVDRAHHEIFRAKVGKGGESTKISCAGPIIKSSKHQMENNPCADSEGGQGVQTPQ